MSTRRKRIGILTGGGDVPGLNSVIKSVVYRGWEHGLEVIGIVNASDSWSMPVPRMEFAHADMAFAATARTSGAPLDLGLELNATTELSVHLSVDYELSS